MRVEQPVPDPWPTENLTKSSHRLVTLVPGDVPVSAPAVEVAAGYQNRSRVNHQQSWKTELAALMPSLEVAVRPVTSAF
jgi:hypothetical protein